MPGIEDLIGDDGVIKEMMLWGVVNQIVAAMIKPAWDLLAQDVAAAHPTVPIDPGTLATLVARNLMAIDDAKATAGKSGVSGDDIDVLVRQAKVRIDPASLATAVIRSYMTLGEAQAVATPQGVDAGDMAILADLAGDAPGADQLAQALRRGIIPDNGKGAASISFAQGIAETRLHDKWAPVLAALSIALLSPADAAEAAIRNFLPVEQAEKIAEQNGVRAADFATMMHLAGDAPGPQQLAEALRRGAIPQAGSGPESVSFEQGIAEGRLADKWAPVIQALARDWPTPADALRATLQGQVSQQEGLALYERLGGDPQFWTVMFNSEGSSPTPLELIEMANRGLIPWDGTGPESVSYEQGFLEGPWRDKWAGPYRKLGEYVPPISSITQLLSHGAMTAGQAAAELSKQGMSPELVAAYIEDAHITQLSEYRGLSQATAIDAYKSHLITESQLTDILGSLHVNEHAIPLIIEYADFERAYAQMNSAVSRVRSLYSGRKITLQTARESLAALNLPIEAVTSMLDTWSLENAIGVKTLTELQIATAFEYGILTSDEAVTELVNSGYTPFDAWVLLGVAAKAPQPNRPGTGPGPIGGQVVPGTT